MDIPHILGNNTVYNEQGREGCYGMAKHLPGYEVYHNRARGIKTYLPTIDNHLIWDHYFTTATEAYEFAKQKAKEKELEELEDERSTGSIT